MTDPDALQSLRDLIGQLALPIEHYTDMNDVVTAGMELTLMGELIARFVASEEAVEKVAIKICDLHWGSTQMWPGKPEAFKRDYRDWSCAVLNLIAGAGMGR